MSKTKITVTEAGKARHRRQKEQELIEGYRAMAKEDAETAEARIAAVKAEEMINRALRKVGGRGRLKKVYL